MKIIYMGTPQFAVAPMLALHKAGHEICVAVTQPDKSSSRRGGRVEFSAVKKAALQSGIQLYQPAAVSGGESEMYLRGFNADVCVICAYGQLLRPNILNLTKYGCLNIHASLLPRYRGAAPIHRSIIDGNDETGVSIMYMDAGLDTGDVMIVKKTDITPNMTLGELYDALSEAGAALINEALELLEAGCAPRIIQDEAYASYAKKIEKEECEVRFEEDAKKIYDLIRGLNPVPGAYSFLDGRKVNFYDAAYCAVTFAQPPGSVAARSREGITLACGRGSVIIKTLKAQDKQKMAATDFLNGLRGEKIRFGR